MKKYSLLFLFIFVFISGCNKNQSTHECIEGTWVFEEKTLCLTESIAKYNCNICNETIEIAVKKKYHNIKTDEKEATCSVDGYYIEQCMDCDYVYQITFEKTNQHSYYYEIINPATVGRLGTKQQVCEICQCVGKSVKYANNGYLDHGKLSVNGPDLVDKNNEKFQLIGLSTHGIQWFSEFINYDTFDSLHNEFGINVIRLALTTAEGGYCEADDVKREFLYQKVVEGVKLATSLDMYVIVDWHMVGADDVNDKNPMYYKDNAIEFFSRITQELKDYNNVLYEIMNEPNGSTSWEACKNYANLVIPVIRKNTDAIVLVGNPNWSSNLNAVIHSPLEGYNNIMYTYHFYAADHPNTYQVENAYDNGFPVFISEHGGMESSGDGAINYENIQKWYSILDKRNISYVAWNLSNSLCSSSILKHNTSNITDFKDDNLREWGIWYKSWVRKKFGLDYK